MRSPRWRSPQWLFASSRTNSSSKMSRLITLGPGKAVRSRSRGPVARHRVRDEVEAPVAVRAEVQVVVECHLVDRGGQRPQMVGAVVDADGEARAAAADERLRACQGVRLRPLDVQLHV